MSVNPTICFIIPYFGKWPFWFPFFLESCRANPTIQWRFHTDCGVPETICDNVKFIDFMIWKNREWRTNPPAGAFDAASIAATGRWQISAAGFCKS